MASEGIVWHGLKEFDAVMDRILAAVDGATARGVGEAAHLVEAKAKANASGHPGPGVVTGANRRSIYVDGPRREGIGAYSARIGPSMIYSRRLELGFDGADSLGRIYHQAPRAFLRPALDDARSEFDAIFAKHWGAAVEGVKG